MPRLAAVCPECSVTFSHWPCERQRCCSIKCRDKRLERISVDTFWANVAKSDTCWIWTGTIARDGYGQCYGRTGMPRRAHRMAWVLTFGPMIGDAIVCHRCDNPLCVRPDHLFLGTQRDNMADKVAKQRQARGETNHKARLTEAQVIDIRKERAAGATLKHLARKYGLRSRSTIQFIVTGGTWKHVA